MDRHSKLFSLFETLLQGEEIESVFKHGQVANFSDNGDSYFLYHLYDERDISATVYHLSLLRRNEEEGKAYVEFAFHPREKTLQLEYYQDEHYELHFEDHLLRKGEDYEDLCIMTENWIMALVEDLRRTHDNTVNISDNMAHHVSLAVA